MRSRAVRLLALCSLLLGVVSALTAPAAEDRLPPEEVKAEAAFKRIAERAKSGLVDVARLRQELWGFRLAHMGTRAAIKGGELMSELPSPLDRLEQRTIAPIEKFD